MDKELGTHREFILLSTRTTNDRTARFAAH